MSTYPIAPTSECPRGRSAGKVLGTLAAAVATLLASAAVGAVIAATDPPPSSWPYERSTHPEDRPR
jgi:hypothetical protein